MDLRPLLYFKTSHVIVYRAFGKIIITFLPLFQNISCYCLSSNPMQYVKFPKVFQNISCYCLSSLRPYITYHLQDFKTSHVIVYH